MSLPFLAVLSVSAFFLAILETAKRRFNIETVYTRKTAHIFFFAVILTSYFVLTKAEAVTILCIFLAVFTISFIKYLLLSIHIKKYKTFGEILYILAFIALFLFFGESRQAFVSAAFVLGILDPASALIKKTSKQRISYNVAYFILCLALLVSIAVFYKNFNPAALIIAAATAALADRYSEYGFDNITVPIAVALILAWS